MYIIYIQKAWKERERERFKKSGGVTQMFCGRSWQFLPSVCWLRAPWARHLRQRSDLYRHEMKVVMLYIIHYHTIVMYHHIPFIIIYLNVENQFLVCWIWKCSCLFVEFWCTTLPEMVKVCWDSLVHIHQPTMILVIVQLVAFCSSGHYFSHLFTSFQHTYPYVLTCSNPCIVRSSSFWRY